MVVEGVHGVPTQWDALLTEKPRLRRTVLDVGGHDGSKHNSMGFMISSLFSL